MQMHQQQMLKQKEHDLHLKQQHFAMVFYVIL